MRAAHVNAGWPADFPGDGPRGVSDHDPQVARFTTRPTLTVADASVTEGNSGFRDAVFVATLSRPVAHEVKACAVPAGGNATPVLDYKLTANCVTFAPGQTTAELLRVPVRGDRKNEPDETFNVVALALGGVRVDNPVATGTIVDDDSIPTTRKDAFASPGAERQDL